MVRHTQLIVVMAACAMPALTAGQDTPDRNARSRGSDPQQPAGQREAPSTANDSGHGDRQFAQELGWEVTAVDDGVRIGRIATDSPVARAHLEENDIIIKVAGQRVRTIEQLDDILRKLIDEDAPRANVVVLRDGEELSYLLPLDSVASTARTAETRSSAPAGDSDLVQMIRQLQIESQRQQELLQTVLAELQNLRLQISGPAAGQTVDGTRTQGGVSNPPGPATTPAPSRGTPPTRPATP